LREREWLLSRRFYVNKHSESPLIMNFRNLRNDVTIIENFPQNLGYPEQKTPLHQEEERKLTLLETKERRRAKFFHHI
jgi:hypothetical protein